MAIITDTDPDYATAKLFDLDDKAYSIEWQDQREIYDLAWKYYSGAIFDERRTDTKDGKPGSLLYPLRVNSTKQACITHALHLWGLTSEAPILSFSVIPKSENTDASYERAERLRQFCYDLFNKQGMPNRLREAGRLFNALGGACFKVRSDKEHPLGIALENVPVRHLYPVWMPTDYEQLVRAHIAFWIPTSIAQEIYGYQGQGQLTDEVEYIETWTLDNWVTTVGLKSRREVAKDPLSGLPLQGENTFKHPITGQKYIPLVYVPRLRTGRFWGDSLIEDLRGLQDEFNGRLADQGDAVVASSHMHPWGRNLSRKRTPGPLSLPSGNQIFDAGDTQVGGGDPLIDNLIGPSLTDAVANFSDQVEQLLWDQGSVAPVVRGLDEGSQRSGVTLTARALPTIAITDDYRDAWRTGIALMVELAMIISFTEEINGITHLDFGHDISIEFAPRLPKDITQINETIQIQRAAGVMSRKRALQLSPDVRDVDAELANLEAEQLEKQEQAAELAETQARAKATAAPPPAAKAKVSPKK